MQEKKTRIINIIQKKEGPGGSSFLLNGSGSRCYPVDIAGEHRALFHVRDTQEACRDTLQTNGKECSVFPRDINRVAP